MTGEQGQENVGPVSERTVDRRTFLRTGIVGGATLTAAGVLAAYGPTASSAAAQRPRRGGNLRVGMTGGGSSDTLSPYLGGLTAIGTARVQNLYQPLVQLDENGQVQFILAEQIVPKGSASKWIIRLRKGITFHNGKPFGADDVVAFLQAQVNPKAALSAGPILTPLDPHGIRKLDAHTVEVRMRAPFGSFVEQLAASWWVLYVPPAGWKSGDKPVGTGPFMYESFTPGEQSVFKRNPHYWRSEPYLGTLTIVDFSDPTSLANALISKTIDATGFLSGTQRAALQSAGITTRVTKTGSIQPFTMRVDRAPFTDVNVRQALRLLINRKAMIATALNGYGWVANDVTSPLDPDFDASLTREQDTEQAKHLLKKAGFGHGLKLDLYTSLAIQPTSAAMATVFKQQAQAVGVTVNINEVSASNYFGPNVYTKVPFGMIYYNYSPYLAQVNQTFLPTSPYKETHFNNSTYTKLYYEANKTTSPSLRREISHEMQKIDFNQGGYIIPAYMDVIDAYGSNVHGYVGDKVGEAMGNYDYENFWIG